jgi:hypothetical protein
MSFKVGTSEGEGDDMTLCSVVGNCVQVRAGTNEAVQCILFFF